MGQSAWQVGSVGAVAFHLVAGRRSLVIPVDFEATYAEVCQYGLAPEPGISTDSPSSRSGIDRSSKKTAQVS